MKSVGLISNYPVYVLTKKLARKQIDDLLPLFNLIPLVDVTPEDVLSESKEGRVFHGKWEHSLAVFDRKKVIACIVGYERKAESNEQYPGNSLYINQLTVNKGYQKKGIGRSLLKVFLERSINNGFNVLKGSMNFSIQTVSENWNKHVHDLYKSFGFRIRAEKQYPNRVDLVLGWKP